jgi:hydrogenase maturation protease
MIRRVLVAGVGNVFLGDDGFGVETVRRLASEPLPEGVTLVDVGVRSVHFAFQLLEPFDLVIVIDAVSQRGPPGTVYLLEAIPEDGHPLAAPEGHGMEVGAVLAMARALGAEPVRVLVVGCEPLDLSEGMGLSLPVQGAVPSAAELVRDVLRRELCTVSEPS